jgi:hypothetical protein
METGGRMGNEIKTNRRRGRKRGPWNEDLEASTDIELPNSLENEQESIVCKQRQSYDRLLSCLCVC